jgi:putative ABC transport system permease protein
MSKWEVSGVYVKSKGPIQAENLVYHINNGLIPEAIAVNPGPVMRTFFNTFLQPSTMLLLLIAVLVSVVAGVGILVSIYNSVSARNREIAILRALGATRRRVLLVICVEAGLIGLVGALLGWLLGHLLGAAGSAAMRDYLGQRFNWAAVTRWEVLYVVGVVVGAVLAGLVPALKAYRTPVATNLVAA